MNSFCIWETSVCMAPCCKGHFKMPAKAWMPRISTIINQVFFDRSINSEVLNAAPFPLNITSRPSTNPTIIATRLASSEATPRRGSSIDPVIDTTTKRPMGTSVEPALRMSSRAVRIRPLISFFTPRRMKKYPPIIAARVKGIWTRKNTPSGSPEYFTDKRTPGYNGHQYSHIWRNQ